MTKDKKPETTTIPVIYEKPTSYDDMHEKIKLAYLAIFPTLERREGELLH